MMHISLAGIRRKYQHLYYQDGPVSIEHLTPKLAEYARRTKTGVVLVGLAPQPPPNIGAALLKELSRDTSNAANGPTPQ